MFTWTGRCVQNSRLFRIRNGSGLVQPEPSGTPAESSRYTGDLDLLIRPAPENAGRIITTLSQFGFSGLGITAADLCSPDTVVQLGVAPNRIDLLTSISGVTFDEAWNSRQEAALEGIPTRFIGRDALLRNKESTGRMRDLGDAAELRRRG